MSAKALKMPPFKVAAAILRAAGRRKSVLYPGWQAKTGHVLGTLVPGWTTRFMHRTIYRKLDRTVY